MSVANSKKLRLLLKDAAKGFYQQMYFLGKDVIHPAGNQLESFGFVKSVSRGLKGTSCYTLERESGTIELYGSCAGVYAGANKAVFLRTRCSFYRWIPEGRAVAGLWQPRDIINQDPYTMLQLIRPLLTWWLEYEAWINQCHGKTYREYCYKEWTKVKNAKAWLEPGLATLWIKRFTELEDQHVRPKHMKANWRVRSSLISQAKFTHK